MTLLTILSKIIVVLQTVLLILKLVKQYLLKQSYAGGINDYRVRFLH